MPTDKSSQGIYKGAFLESVATVVTPAFERQISGEQVIFKRHAKSKKTVLGSKSFR